MNTTQAPEMQNRTKK